MLIVTACLAQLVSDVGLLIRFDCVRTAATCTHGVSGPLIALLRPVTIKKIVTVIAVVAVTAAGRNFGYQEIYGDLQVQPLHCKEQNDIYLHHWFDVSEQTN